MPENIAKECFLFEAIDYLLVGYPPMEEVFYGDYNARYSYDLYCEGIENFPDSDDEVYNLFYAKYGVQNPENWSIRENLKYTSINHYQSIQELDDYHTKEVHCITFEAFLKKVISILMNKEIALALFFIPCNCLKQVFFRNFFGVFFKQGFEVRNNLKA